MTMLMNTTSVAGPGSLLSQPRQILSAEALALLNQRSNRVGLLQFAGHLGAIALGGYLWATALMVVGAAGAGALWRGPGADVLCHA
jgi:hypothetical protein